MADAFGRMVLDYHRGELAGQPVYRRSDGSETPAHCAWYFTTADEWDDLDRRAIELARGRLLDVGCGPGRAAVHLCDRGREVLGIDRSLRAVRVARERGAPAHVMDMFSPGLATDAADSALFLGTHLGAVEDGAGLRALLSDLDGILRPGGRVVADLFDPTRVVDPDLRAYLADRRRAPGVTTRRFRLVYDGHEGPWRTLLMCSPDALRDVLAPTAWSIVRAIQGDDTRYVVVLERVSSPEGPDR